MRRGALEKFRDASIHKGSVKYPESVTQLAKEYANSILEGLSDLPEEAKNYIRLASQNLAKRLYYVGAKSETIVDEKPKPRDAKKAPLMRALQRAQQKRWEELKAKGLSKEEIQKHLESEGLANLKGARDAFFERRFRRLWNMVQKGISENIPRLGDIATMQDALREEWEHRAENNSVFHNMQENQIPYNFFWKALEHHRLRAARAEELLEYEYSVVPLPEEVIPLYDEKPLFYKGKPLELARLTTKASLQEEGALQNHCVGGYDIFTTIERGERRGKPETYIFSLYIPLDESVSMREIAEDANGDYYKAEYDTIKTQRKPLVTIEYNANTGNIRQVKLAQNKTIKTLDDPLAQSVFSTLRRIRHYAQENGIPIKSFSSSDLEDIQPKSGFITLDGEDKTLDELTEDDIVVSGGNVQVPANISLKNLQKLSRIRHITLNVTELLQSRPEAFKDIDFVRGSIVYEGDSLPAGTIFPKELQGGLYLSGLTSAINIVLPEVIHECLYLSNLISAKNFILPKKLYGDLDLSSLVSTDGLILPKVFHGGLYLNALTSAKGLVLPKEVHGDLFLTHLTSTEGLVLPEVVHGNLELRGLTSAKGITLPKKVNSVVLRDMPYSEIQMLEEKYPNITIVKWDVKWDNVLDNLRSRLRHLRGQ